MTKQEIRTLYLAKRLQMDPQTKMQWEDDILQQIKHELSIPKGCFFLSFLPILSKGEMQTQSINDYLQEQFDAKLCYPKLNQDTFVPIWMDRDTTDIVYTNRFNIPEPNGGKEIDAQHLGLVIAPLLAFDSNGYRVGYGKGMYDIFFQRVPSTCLKIGCSFFAPLTLIEDINPKFDKKLDFVITPTKTYYF